MLSRTNSGVIVDVLTQRLILLLCAASSGCLFSDPGPGAVGESGETGGTGETGASDATGATGATGETGGSSEGETQDPVMPTTGAPEPGCEWEQVTVDMRPSARIDAAMALATGRGSVLLYGGRAGLIGPDLDDTWRFDGEKWMAVPDGMEHPGPRRGHATAYDAARDRVLMFGGEFGGIDVKFAERTWTHDGKTWRRRQDGPSLRSYTAMADMPRIEEVVLFGGRTDKGPDGETWTWDGEEWSRQEPDTSPSPRFGHVMAPDENGDLLVYGGCGDPVCSMQLDDTWRFDGEDWQRVDDSAAKGVRGGGMARASVQAQTLRLGEGASWRWTGAAWEPAGPAAHALSRFALADLPATGLVLFGGLTAKVLESAETWVLRCAP